MKAHLQRSQHRRTLFCLVVLVGVWLSGSPLTVLAQETPSAENHSSLFPSLGSPADQLGSLPSGPGLVICEPVSLQTSPDVADFGAGCSRWLQFVVGGQGELGKTPLWSDVTRAQQELGRPDLRLTLAEASKLRSMLGITHVAVATIQGTTSHARLTYHLYKLSPRAPIGSPLLAEGTETQILARLPVLAQQIAHALGVASPDVPKQVEGTAAEMTTLGQLGDRDSDTYTPKQVQQLAGLAKRIPLAGMLYLPRAGVLNLLRYQLQIPNDPTADVPAQTLADQTPDNVQVYGQIGRYASPSFPHFEPQVTRLTERYPNNYILAFAGVWRQQTHAGPDGVYQAVKRLVRTDTANPGVWFILGSTTSDLASVVRRGATWAEMSASQQNYVTQVYTQWLRDALRAVKLDPLFGRGWYGVARAASFASDADLANTAFWKATRLDKNDPEIYDWGLEMFQPKWGGDKATLAKVVDMAAASHYALVDKNLYAALLLTSEGYADRAAPIIARSLDVYRARADQEPHNLQLHWIVFRTLIATSQWTEAALTADELLKITPNDATIYRELGWMFYQQRQYDDAIREYRKTLSLDSNDVIAHEYLGLSLEQRGVMDQAEAEFQQVLKRKPDDYTGHLGLGDAYYGLQKYELAIKEYQEALRLEPWQTGVYIHMSQAFLNNHQDNSAMQAAQKATELWPDNGAGFDALGSAYLQLKVPDKAAEAYLNAIHLYSRDPTAHYGLGVAYIQQGKKPEAQAEWQTVLTLDNGSLAAAAQGMLKKYP